MGAVWTCCNCGGENLTDTAPACPLCGHITCQGCAYFYFETASTLAATHRPQNEPPSGSSISKSVEPNNFQTPPPPTLTISALDYSHGEASPYFSKQQASDRGLPQNSLPGDVWVCCGCGGANLWVNSVRCPVCEHYPCGYCNQS